jgi:hypothetical protein
MWLKLPQEASKKQPPKVPRNLYPNATVAAPESCKKATARSTEAPEHKSTESLMHRSLEAQKQQQKRYRSTQKAARR